MNGWPATDETVGARRLIEGVTTAADGALLSLLQALLPLAVASTVRFVRGESWPERLERLARIRQRWQEQGRDSFSEALLHRTRPGQSREEFVDLAEMVAVMAFCPGGVRAFGMHWEEKDDEDRTGDPASP